MKIWQLFFCFCALRQEKTFALTSVLALKSFSIFLAKVRTLSSEVSCEASMLGRSSRSKKATQQISLALRWGPWISCSLNNHVKALLVKLKCLEFYERSSSIIGKVWRNAVQDSSLMASTSISHESPNCGTYYRCLLRMYTSCQSILFSMTLLGVELQTYRNEAVHNSKYKRLKGWTLSRPHIPILASPETSDSHR